MPGCVLRVESRSPDVERLVKASGLQPIVIYRKGQPRVPGSHLSRESGFNVDVSPANGGLDRQARDATRFLKRHEPGLRRLRRSTRCRSIEAGATERHSSRGGRRVRLSNFKVFAAGAAYVGCHVGPRWGKLCSAVSRLFRVFLAGAVFVWLSQ